MDGSEHGIPVGATGEKEGAGIIKSCCDILFMGVSAIVFNDSKLDPFLYSDTDYFLREACARVESSAAANFLRSTVLSSAGPP